jgi:hypothetical protein
VPHHHHVQNRYRHAGVCRRSVQNVKGQRKLQQPVSPKVSAENLLSSCWNNWRIEACHYLSGAGSSGDNARLASVVLVHYLSLGHLLTLLIYTVSKRVLLLVLLSFREVLRRDQAIVAKKLPVSREKKHQQIPVIRHCADLKEGRCCLAFFPIDIFDGLTGWSCYVLFLGRVSVV